MALLESTISPGSEAFQATTAFIEQHADSLLADDADKKRTAHLVAAALLSSAPGNDERQVTALPMPLTLISRFEINGERCEASLALTRSGAFRISTEGAEHLVEIVELLEHDVRFTVDGLMAKASFQREGARLLLSLSGVSFDVVDTTRAAAVRQEAAGDGKLRASMNGRVVAVLVTVGQQVAVGQPVLTLEAMKMEHVHAATTAGTVKAMNVTVGDQVPSGRLVAEIEPDAS